MKIKNIRPETLDFIDKHKKYKGLAYADNKELADTLGYKTPNSITEIVNQRQNIAPDKYRKFSNLIQDYKTRATRKEVKDKVTAVPHDDYMIVEYEDLSTAAGHLGIQDLNLLPDTKKRLVPREFERGKYLVVRVDGHSMDNGTSISIPDGTEILIRELPLDIDARLPIRNNLFVIVSKDGVVLKQITEHNIEEGYIKCHSYNPEFKDYKIPLTDIIQIFIYRKIVSFRPPIPDIITN